MWQVFEFVIGLLIMAPGPQGPRAPGLEGSRRFPSRIRKGLHSSALPSKD